MQGHSAPRPVRRFGPFELDLHTRELRKHGRRLRLAEKPFLVLAALLERPGELVAREELRRLLWADHTFVDFDNNLNSAVATVREALSDSARAPQYVETLPRLGYRFVGAVEPAAEALPADAPAPRADAALAANRRWTLALAGVMVFAVGIWMGAGRAMGPAAGSMPPAPRATSQAYLDGMYLLERGGSDDLRRAEELFRRAAQQDPRDAASYAALAETSIRLVLHGRAPAPDGFAAAEQSANRAHQLDPSLAAVHRTRAMLALLRDWDFDAARAAAVRAVAAAPADSHSHLVAAGVASASGRFNDAVAAARRAIELDPANWRVRADLAFFLVSAGRLEEAAAESREVLELDPRFAPAADFLLIACERLGRFHEAHAAAIRLMELAQASAEETQAVRNAAAPEALQLYREWQVRQVESPTSKRAWPAMAVASIYASAGRRDQAFEWLERAFARREVMVVFLAANPDFLGVRADPRYLAFIRRMGVPALPPLS